MGGGLVRRPHSTGERYNFLIIHQHSLTEVYSPRIVSGTRVSEFVQGGSSFERVVSGLGDLVR